MNKITKITIILALITLATSNQANASLFSWKLPSISVSQLMSDGININWNLPSLANKSVDITIKKATITDSGNTSVVVNQDITVVKTYNVRATAYSSTVDQTDSSPFITASGTTVRDGIIAANFLPFGTVVRIPDVYGDKLFVVEDRMHERYWYNIDIWFPKRGLAQNFGAQKVKIEIVSNESI